MRLVSRRVRDRLDQTSFWDRFQAFLRLLAIVVTVGTAVVWLAGVMMVLDWWTHRSSLIAVFVLLGLLCSIAVFIMAVIAASRSASEKWLAAAMEHAHEPLQDRLNTLVYLDGQPDTRRSSYGLAIQRQTMNVLQTPTQPCPFSWRSVLKHTAVFLVVLVGTCAFYVRYQPWTHVVVPAPQTDQPAATQSAQDLQIPPLDSPAPTVAPEPLPAWGEVRISEPGRDVRVTKPDIVGLKIEAAADSPLDSVYWITSVNGQQPLQHDLPAPLDPKYVVYEPVLVVDQFALEEWDVLSYYAEAVARDGRRFKSSVYFLEVVPFRLDLERLPVGTDGETLRGLNQMTDLIERQQEIMRQTARLSDETETAQSASAAWDRLADAEAELGRNWQHLQAEMQNAFAKETAEKLRPQMQSAASRLQDAEHALRAQNGQDSQQQQQRALQALAASRKQLHQLMQQPPAGDPAKQKAAARLAQTESLQQQLERNIDDYARLEQNIDRAEPPQLSSLAGETKDVVQKLQQSVSDRRESNTSPAGAEPLPPPLAKPHLQDVEQQAQSLPDKPTTETRRQTAQQVKHKLQQTSQALQDELEQQRAERDQRALDKLPENQPADELNAGRKFVQQALGKQRDIQRAARPGNSEKLKELAQKQTELNQEMTDFMQQQAKTLQSVQRECRACQSSMARSQSSLAQGRPMSRTHASQAADELQKLDDALEQSQQENRLAEAYQLKSQLDAQIRQLQRMQQQPQNTTPSQCQSAGQRGRSIPKRLGQLAGQQPLRDALGPQLREALGEQQMQRMQQQSRQLEQAGEPDQISKSAQALAESLQQVARAFSQSCSRPGMQPGNGSPLTPQGRGAVAQGLQRLESVARSQETGRRLSQQEEARMRNNAIRQLDAGLAGEYGRNQRTTNLVRSLRKELKEPQTPLTREALDSLRRNIQMLSQEKLTRENQRTDERPATNLDGSRLPPEYRDAVQRYFEKLSEQP